ncbi:aspartate carbamoyltransferase catalytic subunit [bacterium]|nr:aspartate carbamoyltransferase catalytic subunit [FCB group bacterium]MBL7190715.1 aspartate carbamoyltransferase catalytic subunit [bacterium]
MEGMSKGEILHILETARSFREVIMRPIRIVPTLRGYSVVNMFFEPSTRTRVSFELAEKRLSCESVNFSSGGSSVSKGESLLDTVQTIEAMQVDAVVIRHSAQGAPHFLAERIRSSVINAGDGYHEHPTQALLDMFTLWDKIGGLSGLKVAIVGDIAHSRVALSDIHSLKTLGAEVMLCGPKSLMPFKVESLGVKITSNLEEALEFCDVVYMLRIQLERQAGERFPSIREYRQRYCLTMERIKKFKKDDFIVMHPGPMNRGVEISAEVADSRYSLILNQVTSGVAIRMAVIYLISGGKDRGKF